MLKFFIAALLIVYAQLCTGQVTYSYDDAGNRIKRVVPPSTPTGCYTMMIPGYNKLLTNVNGILKVKLADNSDSQKWKLETSGSYVKVVAATNNQILGVAGGGNTEGDSITLQANGTQDHQLWTRTVIVGSNPEASVFIRKGSSLLFGSTLNWGDGHPSNAITDIRLANDPTYTFGANKWIIQNTACPVTSGRQGVIEEAEVANADLVVSPNPNSGDFDAGFYLDSGKTGTLSVISLDGKLLYQRKITGTGKHKEKISLKTLGSGIYMVRFISEKGVEVKKISVMK
jgi:hypothetical protein